MIRAYTPQRYGNNSSANYIQATIPSDKASFDLMYERFGYNSSDTGLYNVYFVINYNAPINRSLEATFDSFAKNIDPSNVWVSKFIISGGARGEVDNFVSTVIVESFFNFVSSKRNFDQLVIEVENLFIRFKDNEHKSISSKKIKFDAYQADLSYDSSGAGYEEKKQEGKTSKFQIVSDQEIEDMVLEIAGENVGDYSETI
ncbi:MAG: hypothetical protein SFT68_00960 [Rickettsiaceae bacterium]|nr:hypothetical protein [Rickettsiaceae bacterium]